MALPLLGHLQPHGIIVLIPIGVVINAMMDIILKARLIKTEI